MIRTSSDFVLSTLDDGYGYDVTLDNPIVGYHTVATYGNVSADEENPDYPVSNLSNTSTRELWKGETTGTQKLYITGDGANDLDYIGVARPNWAGATVTILHWDGSNETQLYQFIPGDNRPIFVRFERKPATEIRIELDNLSVIPQAAVLYCGLLLTLQRRIYVGHVPTPYGRMPEIDTGISLNGEFLGRTIMRETLSSKFKQDNLSPVWARTRLDPFIQAARTRPFFFGWRPNSYPSEGAFCWLKNFPQINNQRSNGMMNCDFEVGAISHGS